MKKDKTNKNDSSKFKEYYLKFKEDWKVPKKRAGYKLLGYLIFFIIFIIMVRVSSFIDANYSGNNKKDEITTTESVETFREKQKDFLSRNHSISYQININDIVYKINGTIKDNIIEGYLETPDGIKKIIIRDNILYDITNGSEVILDLVIDMNKLDLINIISILEKNKAYISNKDGIKSYQYAISFNDVESSIMVFCNEDSIYNITIKDDVSEYILNFDI